MIKENVRHQTVERITAMTQYTHEEVQIEADIHVKFMIYEDSNHLITEHWHRSMEIIYLYQGSMEVTINSRKHLLSAGDFIVINSADIHATQCYEHTVILLLQIPFDFLQHAIPDYDSIRFTLDKNRSDIPVCSAVHTSEASQKIQHILTSMGSLYQEKPHGYSLRFSSLLYEFLYLLVIHYQISTDSTARIQSQKNLKRLEPVIRYVKEHYTDSVSLTEAASLAALNPEYFCRFFKQNMGMTFTSYVNSVRLAHVCEDLKNTDYHIGTILELNGITNYKLFMKNFKQLYHCTPKEFRQNSHI